VVERGTAASIKRFAPYVAGKTGTTEHENDAWFVGFTNDVTIAVWVGYDNADGKRRTLGRGQTGAKVALPIFTPILEAAWAHHAPKSPLSPPSPQAARQLIALPIDLRSGDRLTEVSGRGFTEYFRLNRYGRLEETQYRLVPEAEVYAYSNPQAWADGEEAGGLSGSDSVYGAQQDYRFNPYYEPPRVEIPRQRPFGPSWWEERPRRPRRIDPDYPWGDRSIY
jgi:penicillin-binding protein 1A